MKNNNQLDWEKKFVEKGAELEHDRWARWQEYMFTKCIENEDGTLTVPATFVVRWWRQIALPYKRLKEEEKESDRKESRNYIPLVEEVLKEQRETLYKEIEGMEKSNLPNILQGRHDIIWESMCMDGIIGYNQAIKDILGRIKK